MKARRRLASGLWLFSIGLSVAGIALLLGSLDVDLPDSWGFRGYPVFSLAFGTVGALIAVRRRNAIGWVCLGIGLVGATQLLVEQYAIYGVVAHPGSLPHPEIFAWLDSWLWVPLETLSAVYLPLLFPTGTLPSPRWRLIALGAPFAGIALAAAMAFAPGPLQNATFQDNPFAVAWFPVATSSLPTLVPLLLSFALAACASLLIRFRVAVGVERAQLKWLLLVLALFAAAAPFSQSVKAAQVVFIVALSSAPVAIGLAVLRYRLYDIDVLIRRTVIYGVISAVLVVTYLAVAAALQAALAPFTAGSQLAVALSTLAVIALLNPLRQRVRNMIDRRFYRRRYDAARTLDLFAARLTDEIDLDTLRRELIGVVDETVQPRHASVWLR